MFFQTNGTGIIIISGGNGYKISFIIKLYSIVKFIIVIFYILLLVVVVLVFT